jgi:hypothetical protein
MNQYLTTSYKTKLYNNRGPLNYIIQEKKITLTRDGSLAHASARKSNNTNYPKASILR